SRNLSKSSRNWTIRMPGLLLSPSSGTGIATLKSIVRWTNGGHWHSAVSGVKKKKRPLQSRRGNSPRRQNAETVKSGFERWVYAILDSGAHHERIQTS